MKPFALTAAFLACSIVAVSAQEQTPAAPAPSPAPAQAPAETAPAAPRPPRPPRPGVSTPGVKRDIAAIKPSGVFAIPGNPDWQVITEDAVWVTSGRKNIVGRLDPKTNTVSDTITAVGPALSEGGIAANADSIWLLSDMKGVLSRIDPATNRLVAEIPVPPGSSVCVLGEDGAIWVVSTEKSVVVRVDPKSNLVTDHVEVGPNPRFTTVGGGSIWTLNQGDGSVSRVDVKTKKLITDIQLGVPGGGGEIAYGEGYVWVTVFEIPLTQIDPDNNKVVKQWFGLGGDAVRVGHGSVWLSNIRQENVWRLSPKQP